MIQVENCPNFKYVQNVTVNWKIANKVLDITCHWHVYPNGPGGKNCTNASTQAH